MDPEGPDSESGDVETTKIVGSSKAHVNQGEALQEDARRYEPYGCCNTAGRGSAAELDLSKGSTSSADTLRCALWMKGSDCSGCAERRRKTSTRSESVKTERSNPLRSCKSLSLHLCNLRKR